MTNPLSRAEKLAREEARLEAHREVEGAATVKEYEEAIEHMRATIRKLKGR